MGSRQTHRRHLVTTSKYLSSKNDGIHGRNKLELGLILSFEEYSRSIHKVETVIDRFYACHLFLCSL